MNGAAAGARMLAILDAPLPPDGLRTLPDGGLCAAVRDLTFSYGDTPVLSGVSFDIPAQGMVSLVGESGCGKSTVAALLTARRGGYRGSVTLGGLELREISRDSLLRRVTLVTHEGHVFAGTVRDNLLPAKPDASDSELRSVLERVRLWDEIRDLDAAISERGSNLSGGQRQRLCLARALLRGGGLYLFDEATSNIDVESETAIMDAIHGLAKTSAVLLISHRLANVVPSAQIYLLDGGRIAERGTHSELLSRNGAYARLWNEQRELENYAAGGSL
jgi:ABC-type multidrug transport system fused ATPase/permease subunit